MQIELINCYRFERKETFKAKKNKRSWDSIIMVLDGSYSIKRANDEKPIVIGQNEVAYIPANLECERFTTMPTTYYIISFTAQPDHPFRLSVKRLKLTIPKEQVDALLKEAEHAFLMPSNRELMTHIARHILFLNYLFGKTPKVNFNSLSEEVLSTISYMNRNLDKRIDMDELASRVFLSHSGLIWKFKQELDTTPSQYLIMLRLRYAKQLLLSHEHNITEIAEMCGYTNPYYFTNAFNRYTGMSPTDFRKHYLKG